jgi:hypothetical protein
MAKTKKNSIYLKNEIYAFLRSSLTVNLWRPLARLLASTFLPFFVAILALKPCLFNLFLLLG